LPFLNAALKDNGDKTLKEKMKLLKEVFLTHREMGECEAYYKLFKDMHLTESNLKTEFIHLGFNKSKFLRKVDELTESGNLVKIEGREGIYVETSSLGDKFDKRPDCLRHMTLIQWYKRYTPIYSSKITLDEGEDEEDEDLNSNLAVENADKKLGL